MRWFLKGLGLAVCLLLIFILIGRTLQRIALRQIAELTNTRIEVQSVDFDLNGSVFIKNLIIRPNWEHKYDDAILKARNVYARFGIGSLLLLRPRLKEIRLNDFVFNAQHDLDTGQWNLAAVKIRVPKGGSGKMPLINLERGTLKYIKVSKGRVKVVAAVPVNARFGLAEKTQDCYSFNITTAGIRRGSGKSTLTGYCRPGNITITGGISSADIPVFEKTWMINVLAAELNYDQNNTYSLKLRIKDLLSKHGRRQDTFGVIEPSLSEDFGLFTALQRFFNRYRPSGQADIDLEASGNLLELCESTLAGKIYCKDVSICDRKFPYPIQHLAGQIDFTEKSTLLKNLCGRHGDTELFFNGWSRGFGANRQYQIQITSDNMALDNDLYNALSTKKKKFWSALSPSGLASINYSHGRQSQTDKKWTLAVELSDADAVYKNFPYPLKNLTGSLFFDRDSITISNVVSQTNERKITLNGKVTSLGTEQPIYDISINAENIPLDSTLAGSLSDRQRRFYNRLNMTGLADAKVKILTSDDSGPADVTTNASLRKTSLKVEDFPLALTDVSAKTVITRDSVHIQNLNGSCGEGSLSMTGKIWPGAESEQLRYHLLLHAEQAQLNDDLFSLLPASLGKIISILQPKGKINYSADLNKAVGADYPDYRITIDCLGNSINSEPFPYPLKNITGSLTITTDSNKARSTAATAAGNVGVSGPNSPTITISGQITQVDNANGRFALDLENVKIFDAETSEKYIDFATSAKFKGCNLNTSPAITELDATLKTKGLYKTGAWFCDGRAVLFADHLRIKDKSLTELKADIDYDRGRQSWLTKNLIANCYDGRLTGKFELKQSAESTLEYLLQVGFDNIDLKQFLWDRAPLHSTSQNENQPKHTSLHLRTLSDTKPKENSRNDYTSGEMDGSLSVIATVGDSSSCIGRCRLAISNMQVGKVSAMAKLLGVLKLTEPKDFAFNQMLIDSYIKHNRVFFRQFDLSGESLAFNGSGWMDLQNENVDLTLTGRGSRLATAEPSFLGSLTEGLGKGIVRIEVTGNAYDPQVTTTTFPVIKETLEILGTPR